MPDAPDWTAVNAALGAALDRDGPDREAFLVGLDGPLRAAVAPLVRDALADDSILDHPSAVLGGLASPPGHVAPSVAEGVTVGPYQILELVGEGGMGRVYRARRADGAFDRTVAVKVVRQSLALAGSDVAARLRRERAVLAALDHPGIARLIDGGETDDGVPYLVTEFVDGPPITAYAAARGLGVADRVRLVAGVARAVDHAHRRFVVHRDLKPSNVLVAERDGPGGGARPVVLDFGIAKLLEAAEAPGGAGSGAFPLTRTGMRLLTPAYAAPELYEPTATVTTAADVYGLGALLYELLTGRRPHDDTGGAGPAVTEPTRPSQLVVARADGAPPSPASHRALRGDLDTICLRALHPDPARRYASAAAFAADLERHLAGEPVEARHDSVAYVVGRFVRRHRAVVASGVLSLVALVGGLGVSLASLGNEREARAEAESSAARATEAAALLGSLFAAADPRQTGGREMTAREALDEGLGRVAGIESDALRGFLLAELGTTYGIIGEAALADSLFRASLAAYEGAGDGFAASRVKLLLADHLVRMDHTAEALVLFTEGYEGVRERADNVPQEVVRALTGRAFALRELGRHDEARRDAELAVETVRGSGGAPFARALYELGYTLTALGEFEGALDAYRESLALYEALDGPDSFTASQSALATGEGLVSLGRYEESEPYFQRAHAYLTQTLGPDHLITGYSLEGLAAVAHSRGDTGRAEALLDSALSLYRAVYAEDHAHIRKTSRLLADVRADIALRSGDTP